MRIERKGSIVRFIILFMDLFVFRWDTRLVTKSSIRSLVDANDEVVAVSRLMGERDAGVS